MKNPVLYVRICLGVAVPLCWCLYAPVAVAGEASVPNRVPLESMNQADYENYHQRLNQQVNGAADTNEQKPAVEEKAPAADKAADQEANSGYGKGYRARMERGGRSGRVGRGGSMTRGGGGRNR